MRLCLFEDHAVSLLEPLTLTRPAFALRCGALTLLERHRQVFKPTEVGALVRPELADLCRLQHEDIRINDLEWLRTGPTVLVNARWLAPADSLDLSTPGVGLVDDQVAYVVVPSVHHECEVETIDDWIATWQETLPQRAAGGAMMDYPWDLVEHNGAAITGDWTWFHKTHPPIRRPEGLAVVGPEDHLVMAKDAQVDPFVVVDTRQGPVLIDRGVKVHSFSRLEGPCYIGPDSWVLGARVRAGTTIGPRCRIGGEIEASIFQGYTNKYHEGFLGHSYLGEWVNVAAGTQVSDLRNDYGQIRVVVAGERLATGLNKVGAFIGDHTKTGLNTLINCGTMVGAFCNLLPTGSLQPQVVPSFCRVVHGQLQEWTDLRQIFTTANTVMRRRDCELSEIHTDYLFWLFENTAEYRQQVIRDSEQRRMRRSV